MKLEEFYSAYTVIEHSPHKIAEPVPQKVLLVKRWTANLFLGYDLLATLSASLNQGVYREKQLRLTVH